MSAGEPTDFLTDFKVELQLLNLMIFLEMYLNREWNSLSREKLFESFKRDVYLGYMRDKGYYLCNNYRGVLSAGNTVR